MGNTDDKIDQSSQVGKSKPKSGVSVPYYDIAQSVLVAKTIHEQGGGACSREQLAPLLKYSGTNNGGFLTRISAAKMFGLVEETGETLRVSQRGQTILSPVMPADAVRGKVEAFLAVDFFSKFYERFKGTSLPQEAGLKNLLANTYAIVPGRIVPSLRVLMDSADQAGFFQVAGNRSKMVKPIIAVSDGGKGEPNGVADVEGSKGSVREPDTGEVGEGTDGGTGHKVPRKKGHGVGEAFDHIPSALLGLLEKLPPVGTVIPPRRRQALTDAFKSMIDFLYPVPEDED